MFRIGLMLIVVAVGPGCTFDRGGLPASSLAAEDAVGLMQFADGGVPDLQPFAPDTGPTLDESILPDVGAVDFVFPDLGPEPCGPDTCSGCCQSNQCQLGDTVTLCGQTGAACQDCTASGTLCIAGICQACNHSTQCPGDTVCLKQPSTAPTGNCEPAWNRLWHIQVVSAEVNCNTAWEGSTSNKPDPYVQVTVGNENLVSKEKYDTCSPVWNAFTDRMLTQSTKVVFTVWDYDSYNADDWIGKVGYPGGVPLAVLREGAMDYQAGNPNDGLLGLKVLFWPLP